MLWNLVKGRADLHKRFMRYYESSRGILTGIPEDDGLNGGVLDGVHLPLAHRQHQLVHQSFHERAKYSVKEKKFKVGEGMGVEYGVLGVRWT